MFKFYAVNMILHFVGIYEATTLERTRKDVPQKLDPLDGISGDELQMSPLPT